jgi:PadR family transcriptional regulator, regulatory protein PadR
MRREFFLNGLPDLVILRLLAAHEMYGYEIVAKISLVSREVLNFGEGCIYPILHRMVAEGFLLERQAMVDGRQRRYYRLSSSGRKQLAAHNRRWEKVCHAVKAIESL